MEESQITDTEDLDRFFLIEDFSRSNYKWYKTNKIIKHDLSRADHVRYHNQIVEKVFKDLNHLCNLLEYEKDQDALTWYNNCLDDDTMIIIPDFIHKFMDTLANNINPEEKEEDEFI